MRKIRVGVLTFSDGRAYIHKDLEPLNRHYQDGLVRALEATGEVEVVAGQAIIGSNLVAQAEGHRLARRDGRYWLAIVPGEFVQFPRKVMVAKGATVTPEWPVAFTRLQCPADDFLANFPCNHIHACYGNWTPELLHVAELLGIEARMFE